MKVRYSILVAVFICCLILINCGSDKTSGVDSDPPQSSSLSVEYTGSKDIGRANHAIEPINLCNSNTASVNVATTGKGCQVTANWTQCSSDDFASYTLYRSTNQFISSDTTSATRLTTVSTASSTDYTDNTVTNATTYYYALKTTDESGLTSWSNEVDVTTPQSSESPSPSDLSLAFTGGSKANTVSCAISTLFSNDRTTVASSGTALSSQTAGKSTCGVTATWTECADGDFLSYTLYRSTSSGISQDTTSADNMGTFTSVSSTEYVDGAVDWETTYYYALITRDTQDLFAWSDEESITTPSSQGGDITVTEPTSSSVWEYGQTNTTVSWTGTTTTSVRIEIWQNGTKLDDFADWVPNTGSYTRAAALPASWGTGANYQIKVIDQDDSYGLSGNFLLNGTIDVTTPSSSTLWTVGETNTQVEWTGGGAQVKLEVWYEGEYVADYCGFITNTGSYTRAAPVSSLWGIGQHFRIRVVESGSSPEDGWSEEFQITDEVDVTNPTSSTSWAWGETGVTVSWNEPYSDNVTIYVYKGGSSVATFASSVPNTGSYTRADAVPSSWGWGDDFKIKVVGDLGSSGYSDDFGIWAMDITQPNSSTVWNWGQTNTQVLWSALVGSEVRMEIWKDDSKVDDYCDWTTNDGSYTRSAAIPEAWGVGDNYQIKMIDDLGNVGWSEEFSIAIDFPIDGIVAYYKLDGDATDETGNHNGSVHGATYDPNGMISGCYSFDGVNDYIDTNYSPSSLAELSISFWLKPESNPPSSAQYIIAVTTGGSHDLGIRYVLPDNTIRGEVRTSSGSAYAYTDAIPDVNWHHIIFTWKRGENAKIYFDGLLCDTNSAYDETNTYADLFIGALNNNGSPSSYPFNGRIDEVGFWERELSSAEAAILYNSGNGVSYP